MALGGGVTRRRVITYKNKLRDPSKKREREAPSSHREGKGGVQERDGRKRRECQRRKREKKK